MATYRSIRRDPDFDAQLSELIYDVRRADEFIEAAEWVLSRNPYEGTRLSGHRAAEGGVGDQRKART
jgi:hypothetical protein